MWISFINWHIFFLSAFPVDRVEIREDRSPPRDFKYLNNNRLSDFPSPMDLSRRRDSVETRKTPSPYNSSSFGSSPPSIVHDSPSTNSVTSMNNAILHTMRNRSDTPTHHYQQSAATGFCALSPAAYPPMFYPIPTKRESPSPINADDIMRQHLHQLEFGSKAGLLGQSAEDFNTYLLKAVALQQTYVAQQQLAARSDSDESTDHLPSVTALSPPLSKPQSPSTTTYPMVATRDGKVPRPFKAYPRNPLNVPAAFNAPDAIIDRDSSDKYHMFRKEMLDQIHAANGGHPTVSNPRMRRTTAKSFVETVDQIQQCQDNNNTDDSMDTTPSANAANDGTNMKDSSYYERRKKNNAAAKKSRDRRRIKEDEIAIRAAFLERENIELKYEVSALKRQLSKYVTT